MSVMVECIVVGFRSFDSLCSSLHHLLRTCVDLFVNCDSNPFGISVCVVIKHLVKNDDG